VGFIDAPEISHDFHGDTNLIVSSFLRLGIVAWWLYKLLRWQQL